jgi:hypothetical protein
MQTLILVVTVAPSQLGALALAAATLNLILRLAFGPKT